MTKCVNDAPKKVNEANGGKGKKDEEKKRKKHDEDNVIRKRSGPKA